MSEVAISRDAVYSAIPTLRVNGQEYAMVSELLLAMEMTEHEGGMSTLELRMSNLASNDRSSADLAFENDGILKLGAKIAVYTGDENAPKEIFRGTITGLEAEFPELGPPELVVLAEDALQQARLSRRTKIWENTSIADVAKELAKQLNLSPVITGLTDKIGTEVQLNESDLAFLRRLLTRFDSDIQVVGNELHVSPRKDVSRGTIELALAGQLRRARVLADLAHQVTKVTVTGWDYKQGQNISGSSTGTNLQPGAGRGGAQILQDAIGDRAEHVGDLGLSNQAEAQALADAIFDHRARPFVVVDGTAEGNPALRVGTQLKLTGLGGRFSNTYYVVRARHKFDLSNGYKTEFEAQCPFLGSGGGA
jgi:phage protein D